LQGTVLSISERSPPRAASGSGVAAPVPGGLIRHSFSEPQWKTGPDFPLLQR
jgi:hypothetical protein